MNATLLQIEEQLRRATEQDDFVEIQRAAALLCRETDAYVKSLPADSPEIFLTCHWLQEAIEWTRLMTLTARARLSDELQSLPALHRYLDSTSTHAPVLTVDV